MPIKSSRPADAGTPPGSATRVRLRAFSRSLPMALLRAREAVMRQFRPSLRAFGLTEQQWRVLRALSSIAECEVTELAHATFLLAPSLSRILRDLEERGLIARRTSARDMRLGLVSLTPAGSRLIDEAGVISERIYAAIAARYGQRRLAELMELLQVLEAALPADDLIPPSDETAPGDGGK